MNIIFFLKQLFHKRCISYNPDGSVITDGEFHRFIAEYLDNLNKVNNYNTKLTEKLCHKYSISYQNLRALISTCLLD